MLLTVLSYVMIIVFMFVIMKKKMSPFTALVLIPLIFALIAIFTGVSNKGSIGDFVMEGIKTTSTTGIMLLFAILYFSIMLDAGLFDPITKKMIHIAKGDPMKVLIATAVVAAAVSLNGDGTTTTLICCSAFIPIYKKLDMKLMNLGVLVILQNTIMNLLPWGGPTARAMSVKCWSRNFSLSDSWYDHCSFICHLHRCSFNGSKRTCPLRCQTANRC